MRTTDTGHAPAPSEAGAPLAEIVLAGPRGFCAGVERAIEIVEQALEVVGVPIYVRREIVHNRHVVEALRHKGAIFVDELIGTLGEAPTRIVVIDSAEEAERLVVEDADKVAYLTQTTLSVDDTRAV